jgi:hypothetical protein
MKPEDFSFWTLDPTKGSVLPYVIGAMIVGFLILFGLTTLPSQARRPITWFLTFLSGGIFVLAAYWPKPINFDPKTQKPTGPVEAFGAFLGDATGVVGTFTQILAAFMLGLGIFSLLRIHLTKIARKKTDWGFSVVLLVSMFAMALFGYWDFHIRKANLKIDYDLAKNWEFPNMARDFLFDKLLQQMDAAMFSIIAFFILSAAYRAFRARSVEATILLGTALVVILSLMGLVSNTWDGIVNNLAANSANKDFIENLRITEISSWIRNTFQTPAITGIRFGIGLGTLSMAIRIWLGLEKGGK